MSGAWSRAGGMLALALLAGCAVAPVRQAPEVVGAHDRGETIRSKGGFWLAIPLPAAGKGPRGKRMTPGLWEKLRGQRLRFVSDLFYFVSALFQVFSQYFFRRIGGNYCFSLRNKIVACISFFHVHNIVFVA